MVKRTGLVNRWGWWLATAGCLLISLAQGASTEIACTVEAGFGGVIPSPGSLLPIKVTIDNSVANTTGQIMAVQRDGATYEVRHLLDFDSPVGSNKRYDLLVRIEPGRTLQVRIDFDGPFKPVVKADFPPAIDKDLVLCIGLPQTHMAALGVGESPYRFLRLRGRDLPEDPLALDGVHAVAIGGAELSALSARQLDTLHEWLTCGGRVIVVSPVAEQAYVAAYGRLAGAGPSPTANAIASVGAGILANSGLVESGEPFWLSGGKPVVDVVQVLFPRLLLAEDDSLVTFADDGIFRSLVPSGGSYGLSGFVWLALIIAAYIVVIGPVDYWICRKTGKPHLTWVIFLGAIAGFSFLAYWYSTLVHSGSMQAVYLNVVDAGAGQPIGRGNGLFWLYSTKNRTYTIAGEVPQPVLSARESPSGSSGVAGVAVVHGEAAHLQARIPIFSSKFFDAAWRAALDTPYEVTEQDGGFLLKLPPAQQAAAVFLADRRGLAALRLDDASGLWRSGDGQPWRDVLDDLISSMPEFQRGYYGGRQERLPDRDDLIRYAQWISFAHLPARTAEEIEAESAKLPGEGDNPIFAPSGKPVIFPGAFDPIEETISRMDGREHRMSAVARLAGNGRLLLIVLSPDSNLFPVQFTSSPVEAARLDVVRLQLADAP